MILVLEFQKAKVFLFFIWILCEVICNNKRNHYVTAENCEPNCEPPNVRTVLFCAGDLERICWSLEDVGLLLNRYIFQILLPNIIPVNMTVFLDYLTICLQTADDLVASERTRELIIDAMADTFGGYLQTFGLPLANEAYYEGSINVKTASQLHILEKDFKKLLKTDGGGWATPLVVDGKICPVKPLRLCYNIKNACDKIIFNKMYNTCENSNGICSKNQIDKNLHIPLPFFDDCANPHAIAVPLKDGSLYSLTNNSSQNILTQYYQISIACINECCEKDNQKCVCEKKLKDFNKKYLTWLKKYVLVHLQDEKWYLAFYNVLPLYRTIEINLNKTSCCGNESTIIEKISIIRDKLIHTLYQPFHLFCFLIGLLLLMCILLRCCGCCSCCNCCGYYDDFDECTCGCESYDEDEAAVPSEYKKPTKFGFATAQKDEEICRSCTCRSNAKASILAKFYCRKRPPCYDDTCPKKSGTYQR